MKGKEVETIGRIAHQSGREYNILEMLNAEDGAFSLEGELLNFSSSIIKAIRSGYVLKDCADEVLRSAWRRFAEQHAHESSMSSATVQEEDEHVGIPDMPSEGETSLALDAQAQAATETVETAVTAGVVVAGAIDAVDASETPVAALPAELAASDVGDDVWDTVSPDVSDPEMERQEESEAGIAGTKSAEDAEDAERDSRIGAGEAATMGKNVDPFALF